MALSLRMFIGFKTDWHKDKSKAWFSQSFLRLSIPSADRMRRRPARAAAADEEEGAVEKIKLRARLIRRSINDLVPQM